MSALGDIRSEYNLPPLLESVIPLDPFDLFDTWMEAALNAKLPEPTAMTLATCTKEGHPSARIVLLKGYDRRGFVFFTNYESRKGRELAENPNASIILFWPELHRQIRIEGTVVRTSDSESDEYHDTRPRGSQLGAWSSWQSEVISGREILESRLKELLARFGEGPIPRPPHWGGYRLIPIRFEFWQGQPSRLHDRFRYRLEGESWVRERLSP